MQDERVPRGAGRRRGRRRARRARSRARLRLRRDQAETVVQARPRPRPSTPSPSPGPHPGADLQQPLRRCGHGALRLLRRRHRSVRAAAERPGARHRLRGRQAGLHPHQRSCRRRERPAGQQRHGRLQQGRLRDAARQGRARRRRRGQRRRLIKVDPSRRRPQAASARRLRQGRRRRAGRGHRQPPGLRLLHHLRHRLRHGPHAAGAQRPDGSPTASRRTPPSTRATPAGR